MKTGRPIRVLIVHHSPIFHTLLSGVLGRFRDIRVFQSTAERGQIRDRILEHHPDLLILDLDLPDHTTEVLLDSLREHYPVPIIACGGASRYDGRRVLTLIERGVLDVVVKPRGFGPQPIRLLGDELVRKIREAVAKARPIRTADIRPPTERRLSFREANIIPQRYLIVIGASTGGPEALRELLSHMPSDSPGIAIVQHMPAFFTSSFAQRLDQCCPLNVSEAADGDTLTPGRAVVARGDTHLVVHRSGDGWCTRYTHSRKVNRHCPSVDVLFDSAVEEAGRQAVGILLTGMGADGARGLHKLRACGALTLAQDSASCAVFGMPKAAQELDAVDLIGSPSNLPAMLIGALAARRCRIPGVNNTRRASLP